MNQLLKTAICIFSGFLFFSCEKTIEFKGGDIQPRIVVYGNVIPGQPITASLFRSRSLFRAERFFESLPNAKADLYVNDILLETLVYEGRIDTLTEHLAYDVINEFTYHVGNYRGETVGEIGKTYRLEISCDGFDPVSCETTVPQAVDITKIDTFMSYAETDYGNNVQVGIGVHFKDPADGENFYRLQSDNTRGIVQFDRYNPQGENFVPTDTIVVRKNFGEGLNLMDPIFNNENQANDIILGTPYNRFGIFDDGMINGKSYMLSFSTFGYNILPEELEHGNFNLWEISLISMSKGFYDYLNSANYHFWYSDDPFSEPVPVYSNVKGGMGIWASSNASNAKVLIGTYPMEGKTYIENNGYYGGYGSSPYMPY